MIRQFELVERVRAYDPNANEDALNRAYVYSMKAHGHQTRASGDPYFSHPLEVAGILTRYRLDSASIITALLHDTIEDTDANIDELQELFGQEIAELVDGVTKLSQLEMLSDKSKQAENFRKLVLAMSKDIRVLLVKLADRLHNMQTLHYIKKPEKRARIARETMDIYVPLAERIGMHEIKDELQDMAFATLNPDARNSVLARLTFLRSEGGGTVERIINELQDVLTTQGIDATVSGREKTPYSIWRKMQQRQVGFEMLADVMAFRTIVDTIPACYQTLGVLHARYPVVPGRFKDYISTPKPNGYQSLHTGLLGPETNRIEVQIRTKEMHDIAERGVAAHWQYRQGSVNAREGRQYRWLQELLDILESATAPEEFLEHTKLEMFQDQVFCFSPKGEVFALPHGATPLDFAYAVHSEVGDRCVGAKVNGRLVPLRADLRNGDQVEILTSQNQTPSPAWEQIVVTGKARSRIRRFVRQEQRREYVRLGRVIVEKAFRRADKRLSEQVLDKARTPLRCDRVEDIYARVGEGTFTGAEVLKAAYPEQKAGDGRDGGPLGRVFRRRRKPAAGDHAVPIRGLVPGLAVHMAHCCYPLPGERIVGIVTTGKGVTVHTIDCDTLASFSESPERWLDVSWDAGDQSGEAMASRLQVVLLNEAGSLGEMATLIAKGEGNIANLKITQRNVDFFDMLVDVEVKDVAQLSNIMAILRGSPLVSSVRRARS